MLRLSPCHPSHAAQCTGLLWLYIVAGFCWCSNVEVSFLFYAPIHFFAQILTHTPTILSVCHVGAVTCTGLCGPVLPLNGLCIINSMCILYLFMCFWEKQLCVVRVPTLNF